MTEMVSNESQTYTAHVDIFKIVCFVQSTVQKSKRFNFMEDKENQQIFVIQTPETNLRYFFAQTNT